MSIDYSTFISLIGIIELTLIFVDGNRSEPTESGLVIFSIRITTVRYNGETGFRMKIEREEAKDFKIFSKIKQNFKNDFVFLNIVGNFNVFIRKCENFVKIL